MKNHRTGSKLVFELGRRDAKLLTDLLGLYPRVPPAHHRLSRSGKLPEPEANQALLEEALAEQRAENQKAIQAFLADPKRFAKKEEGARLTLSPVDVEWLLQVLNDVRIGSWLRLGSPEEPFSKLSPETAMDFWAMEACGIFEMQLIEATS